MATKTKQLPLGKTATFYCEQNGLKLGGTVVAKARRIAGAAGARQIKVEHVLEARGLDVELADKIRGQRIYQARKAKTA